MSVGHWSITEQLRDFGPGTLAAPVSLEKARRYCRQLARRHYENFVVASWLLPRDLRQHFANLYAYCRWADDLADELGDAALSLRLLDWWEEQLTQCYQGHAHHPVFLALRETIQQFAIPAEPLHDLLVAFRRDQQPTPFVTWADVLGYCRYSANPVGRLVLQVARCAVPAMCGLSDSICTGLQLANFCQDAALDARRGRIYFPQDELDRLACSREEWLRPQATSAKRRFLALQVDRAEGFLLAGFPLTECVPSWLRRDLQLFITGGREIIKCIRQVDHDVWSDRPRVTKSAQLRLLASAWRDGRRPISVEHGGRGASCDPVRHVEADPRVVLASYQVCRQLGRQSASSFRWSFWALPSVQRESMHALYAFLRRTDDLVDEAEADQRTATVLDHWRCTLMAVLDGVPHGGIWPALRDTVERHQIPSQYLLDAIDGVGMDLMQQQYGTFEELTTYCYRVASVVGLSCLHIWGCGSPDAREPARKCGIALQLTNILRDLRDDARRGRVYLPLEELERFDYSVDQLRLGVADARFEALMAWQIERAERYYEESQSLAPYLDLPARRVFIAMVDTYRALLRRIKQCPSDVLRSAVPIRLGKPRLAWIAGRAWWKAGDPPR